MHCKQMGVQWRCESHTDAAAAAADDDDDDDDDDVDDVGDK